ncbi:acetolactate synthase-like protein isoform X3 [Corvus moneduloides]|uniref:acetolactate synthase-like protein isoform X3 n=1 Tax=Corvus moneduloides TaxID=1196302 RepID=UPI0013640BB5|nr:acetolactate synthase-like protein isoform X3 [Corvus moneduloides]
MSPSPPMDLVAGLGCACAGLVALALLVVAQRLGLLYRLCHKVDTASPRHGGELVAEVLRAHGVRFLFTLPGGHISPVLVACEKLGIRVVDTRHEATAVFAADAVSRLSGRIGVAAVTAGPGVTNTVTAVKNAQMAESPLLLLGGAAATLQKGRGALQDIPQVPLFRTLCKAALSVRAVRDIVPTLRRAIATAMEGTPGPVFVELPIDVLYPFHVVQKEIGGPKTPRGLRGKLVQWYLGNYLQDLFAGAWEPRDPTPLPLRVPTAAPEQVQRCAELLSRARRPLVLVGSQALLPPTPAEELRSALESLGVPCYLGGAARGLLSPECPLLLRQNRRDALRDADLVLLAGTVCDFRLSYGRLFGRGTAVVAVNRNRTQLLRNSDVFWKPRLALQGQGGSGDTNRDFGATNRDFGVTSEVVLGQNEVVLGQNEAVLGQNEAVWDQNEVVWARMRWFGVRMRQFWVKPRPDAAAAQFRRLLEAGDSGDTNRDFGDTNRDFGVTNEVGLGQNEAVLGQNEAVWDQNEVVWARMRWFWVRMRWFWVKPRPDAAAAQF